MIVVVLADTHLKGPIGMGLSKGGLVAIASADVVLHAGDIVARETLEDLAHMVRTYAVLGNNDHGLAGLLPIELELELEGVKVAMVHDGGAGQGRPARLHRSFPAADIVVCGHSHAPLNEVGVGGQILFNPGSATRRRHEPHHTIGRLEIADGEIVDRSILVI